MAYSTTVFVKYKPKGRSEAHDPVEIASGDSIPVPNVGDIIDCKNVGDAVVGQTNKYKVLARYLTYSEEHCTVFLTIADLRGR